MVDGIDKIGHVAMAIHKLNDAKTNVGGTDTSFDIMNIAAPRAGTLRYTRPDTGEVVVAAPGDVMYSTATMLAEEFFDGENWINLETGEVIV